MHLHQLKPIFRCICISAGVVAQGVLSRSAGLRWPLVWPVCRVPQCLRRWRSSVGHLRQSCHAPWGHHDPCKWEPWGGNLQGSPHRNPLMRSVVEACRAVQQCACGRGYRRAADGSSFCTLAHGVVGQMICCTDNGRFLVALRQERAVRPQAAPPIFAAKRRRGIGPQLRGQGCVLPGSSTANFAGAAVRLSSTYPAWWADAQTETRSLWACVTHPSGGRQCA